MSTMLSQPAAAPAAFVRWPAALTPAKAQRHAAQRSVQVLRQQAALPVKEQPAEVGFGKRMWRRLTQWRRRPSQKAMRGGAHQHEEKGSNAEATAITASTGGESTALPREMPVAAAMAAMKRTRLDPMNDVADPQEPPADLEAAMALASTLGAGLLYGFVAGLFGLALRASAPLPVPPPTAVQLEQRVTVVPNLNTIEIAEPLAPVTKPATVATVPLAVAPGPLAAQTVDMDTRALSGTAMMIAKTTLDISAIVLGALAKAIPSIISLMHTFATYVMIPLGQVLLHGGAAAARESAAFVSSGSMNLDPSAASAGSASELEQASGVVLNGAATALDALAGLAPKAEGAANYVANKAAPVAQEALRVSSRLASEAAEKF